MESGVPVFRAYDDNFLQLGDQRYFSGLLIHRQRTTAPWGPERLSLLTVAHLAAVIASPPEVLLIGTGRATSFPNTDVINALESAHVPFECMDTRAAVRTYNILVTEGRNVSAAMLPPAARDKPSARR